MLSEDLLEENQNSTVRIVTDRISTTSEILQAAILDRYGVETFRKRYYLSSK